jgi:transcription antitermination protein NusB
MRYKHQISGRELALLALSQLSKAEKRTAQAAAPKDLTATLEELTVKAIATLREEADQNLEAAGAELQRANDRLLNSQTRASDVQSARAMTQEAIELTNAAIDRLAQAMSFPEALSSTYHLSDVRQYALDLLAKIVMEQQAIDDLLNESMVNWQLSRLPKLDRDLLRIATAEIVYLGLDPRIAIDRAIELAKIYSDDRGRKFINGVLRRVTDTLTARAGIPTP